MVEEIIARCDRGEHPLNRSAGGLEVVRRPKWASHIGNLKLEIGNSPKMRLRRGEDELRFSVPPTGNQSSATKSLWAPALGRAVYWEARLCKLRNAMAAVDRDTPVTILTLPMRSGITQWISPLTDFLSCRKSRAILAQSRSLIGGRGPTFRTSRAIRSSSAAPRTSRRRPSRNTASKPQ